MKCLQWWIILSSTYLTSCWQYFSSLSNLVRTNLAPNEGPNPTYYSFGDCTNEKNTLYLHLTLDYSQIIGKIIMRAWIDIKKIPTCIKLRGSSVLESDMFKDTAFQFQICVTRIIFCHSQQVHDYFYYEWFIPPDMVSGINWDMYFYGAPPDNETTSNAVATEATP